MKTLLAAIALTLFSVTAFADPRMDANESATGVYDNQADENFDNSTDDC
jgi:hypothetical protein